jgi:hypothetical protein
VHLMALCVELLWWYSSHSITYMWTINASACELNSFPSKMEDLKGCHDGQKSVIHLHHSSQETSASPGHLIVLWLVIGCRL